MRVSLARDRTRACEGTSPFASSRASGFREHTTVARFRQRHQDALAEVFGEALSPEAPSRLCATATWKASAVASPSYARSDHCKYCSCQAAHLAFRVHGLLGPSRG